jgi:hypothetical protein
MYLIYINYLIYMLYIYNKLVCTLYSLHEGDSCYACYFPSRIIGFYGAERGEKPVLLLVNNSPIYWGAEQTTFSFLSSHHRVGFIFGKKYMWYMCKT